MSLSVRLYRCFRSDQRISMDVFADSMREAIEQCGVPTFEYTPKSSLEQFKDNVWVMRYLRYFDYPRKVGKLDSKVPAIHHVIDHGYAHLYPRLGSGPKVVTTHDLIPLLTWKGMLAGSNSTEKPSSLKKSASHKKPRLNIHSLNYLSCFDHITAVSESTAGDLVEHLGVEKGKITVIPPVISSRFKPADASQVCEFRHNYNLTESAKWVMLSGAEHYKNHESSLRAFLQVIENTDIPLKLVRTGKKSTEFDRLLKKYGLENHVRQIYIENADDLPILYSTIDCLLFPSLYEGFGMPVAESLACGTPVVISDRGALPEIAPDLLDVTDALDIGGLATQLVRSLENQDWRSKVAEVGPQQVKKYSQDNVGRQYHALYSELINCERV